MPPTQRPTASVSHRVPAVKRNQIFLLGFSSRGTGKSARCRPLTSPCGAFSRPLWTTSPLGMPRACQRSCRVPRRRKGKPPTQTRARGMRESCHDKRTAAFQPIISERNPDLTGIIACFNACHSSISMLLTVLFSSYNKLTTVLKILDNGCALGHNNANHAVAGVSRHEKPLRKMGNTTARWQRQKAFSYQ